MKPVLVPIYQALRSGKTASPARGSRIALYSHDTMGIGHLRRNLLIAQALGSSRVGASILLVAGTRAAGVFDLPPGVDCLTLPSLSKGGDGSYGTRNLGVGLGELVALRARTLAAALEAFEPDVLIVDKVPRGAMRELEPALETLTGRGTRCVLGLREVLDEAAVVRQEWDHLANEEAIRAYYDAIWVYGDPLVCDQVTEYDFAPDIAAKVRYTGYFDQRQRLTLPGGQCRDAVKELGLPPGRLALCMVGGGQDGERLAEAFAQADFPIGTNGVLVTGPFMPTEVRSRLDRLAAGRTSLRICGFLAEPANLLKRADAVIAMGGYNTVSEILSFDKPALIVPRVHPRQEQWIRSQRLRDLGLVDMLHPDELCPQSLSRWLAGELSMAASIPRCSIRDRLDFDGLSRLPHLLDEVLAREPVAAGECSHQTFIPRQPAVPASRR